MSEETNLKESLHIREISDHRQINSISSETSCTTEIKTGNLCKRYFGPIKSGSLRGAILYITSICLGPGSLSFPIALSNLGLIPGTILYLLLTGLAYISLINLLETGIKKNIMNYNELIRECLGNKMRLISDINNMIFYFGVLMAYQFTASSFFMELMNTLFNTDVNNTTIKFIQMSVCMLLFQIPLSLLKDVSKLQYASIVGQLALIYTVFVIAIESIFYYREGTNEGRTIKLFTEFNWSYLDSFSIFLYGYVVHTGIFAVFVELKRPTIRRTRKVLNRSFISLFIIFSIVTYCGFFSIIKNTPSIFISRPDLKILNGKDYFINVSKILFFFCIQFLSPITYNIMRGSIKSFFFSGRDFSFPVEFTITILVYFVSNTLTFYIDNIVKIIGILGGVCAVITCYICPTMAYVIANDLPRYHWKNVSSVLVLVIICILGIMSTINTAIALFR